MMLRLDQRRASCAVKTAALSASRYGLVSKILDWNRYSMSPSMLNVVIIYSAVFAVLSGVQVLLLFGDPCGNGRSHFAEPQKS
jgi:hypothetical protein